MKKFTIEVSHASGPQLSTIALELKVMSNNWERFGPRIRINKRALEGPQLHESNKRATSKRHTMNTFQ